MKILLIGEYSNVHATLAEGLRALGHLVTVVSDGDSWKNYPRDISICRTSTKLGGLKLLAKIYTLLPRLRGYDIVQLINPMFAELKAERLFPIYRYLRKHNKAMVLCAFGMDWYWVDTCINRKPLRYSDFNIGDKLRTNADAIKERHDWIGTAKERLNKYIAADCDCIVTGLYEYHVCYAPVFPNKTTFIPFPIKVPPYTGPAAPHNILKLFIGINKTRSEYKGTDIMLKAAKDIVYKYPGRVSLTEAVSVPFAQYEKMVEGSDAILDQLYSYTPSMNPLMAMSKGVICIGGGENENYEILGENTLMPIINVLPTYDSVYNELEKLVLHPEQIPGLKRMSHQYVEKHHDYIKVAEKYIEIYNKAIKKFAKPLRFH